MSKQKLRIIDIFSGCGGLSEGFKKTGEYEFVAHVEWEKPMIDTLRHNLVNRWGYSLQDSIEKVIHFDIQKTDELLDGGWSQESQDLYLKTNSPNLCKNGLKKQIKGKKVDIIIGGPPCQAYSIAGRAQDGKSMKDDYRNYLFENFVKLVKEFQPEIFVFENVPGMLSSKPGDKLVIERIYEAFNEVDYEILEPQQMKRSIFSSKYYNVAQDRKRVIIFGVKKGSKYKVQDFYEALEARKSDDILTVKDVIGNYPKLYPLKEIIKIDGKNVSHTCETLDTLTSHTPRFHNLRDIKIFREWVSAEMNKKSSKEKIEFYFDKVGRTTNHNKYRNLEWDKPSPTIVAHLSKDGLLFIHPDKEQARTLTIREAATLQSFPEDFEFISSSSYAYKMIGNAVPVNFSEAIARSIVDVFEGDINE